MVSLGTSFKSQAKPALFGGFKPVGLAVSGVQNRHGRGSRCEVASRRNSQRGPSVKFGVEGKVLEKLPSTSLEAFWIEMLFSSHVWKAILFTWQVSLGGSLSPQIWSPGWRGLLWPWDSFLYCVKFKSCCNPAASSRRIPRLSAYTESESAKKGRSGRVFQVCWGRRSDTVLLTG